MSSPSPDVEFARSLTAKAREDLEALLVLHESGGIADAIIGFHAQQAVEKALKAMLVLAGWPLRRTHDLRFLLQESERLGIAIPEPTASAEWLTPWAVELRYDEFLDESLDRDHAVTTALAALELVEARVAPRPS